MKKLFVLLGSIGILYGCSSDEAVTNKPLTSIEVSRSQQSIIDSEGNFSFKFLNKVTAKGEEQNENVVFSPLGVFVNLSMLANGMDDEAYEETRKAMTLDESVNPEELNELTIALIESLIKADNRTDVKFASSLWLNKSGIEVNQNAADKLKQYYSAAVSTVDMYGESAKNAINSWCSKNTSGLIKEFYEEAPKCRMALLNAVYFDGEWSTPFYVDNTDRGEFNNIDGSKSTVLMMNKREQMLTVKIDSILAAKLPYGNGAYSLYVIMPEEGSDYEAVLNSIDGEKWNQIKASMIEGKVDIALPKFELGYKLDARPALMELGVKKIFVNPFEGLCNFAKFDITEFTLKFYQKSQLNVDENGAKFAAVTSTEDYITSPKPQTVENFTVNRPFIFLITEWSTGTVMTIGRVNKL